MATNKWTALREKREALLAGLAALDASAGNGPLTDEQQAHFDTDMAELSAIGAELDRHQQLLLEQEREVNANPPPPPRKPGDPPALMIGDDDGPALMLPTLPSRTLRTIQAMGGGARGRPTVGREHFAAVVQAALGGNPFHPSLLPQAASEGVGSEGGFRIAPEYAAGIWARAAEGSVFLRIGVRIETMGSDTKVVTALDDADESSDKEAALQAGFTPEAGDPAGQTLLLRQIELRAKKLQINVVVPNELGEDAGPDYVFALEGALIRGISKKIDRQIISGTGAGQFAGLLTAASTITVSKTVDSDPGTANTFTFRHAVGMWSRLAPGSHENAYWLMHPTVLPQALQMHVKVMNVALSDNVGGFQPAGAFTQGGPTGYMLLGRPVVITGRVKALSTAGDVLLVDPTQVALGIRRSIVVARSDHAYFSSDRLGVRATFRGDSGSLWNTPRTLVEGSTTVGPAVIVASR